MAAINPNSVLSPLSSSTRRIVGMPILISHSSVTLSEPSKESVISNTTGPASASSPISMINGSSALVNS